MLTPPRGRAKLSSFLSFPQKYLDRPIRALRAQLAVRMAQSTHGTDLYPRSGPSEAIIHVHFPYAYSKGSGAGRRHALRKESAKLWASLIWESRPMPGGRWGRAEDLSAAL